MKNKKIFALLLAPVVLTLAGCNRHSPEDNPIPPAVTNILNQPPTPPTPPAPPAVAPTNVPPAAPDLNITNNPQTNNQSTNQ